MLTFLACNKEPASSQQDKEEDLVIQEISAKLQKDEYPMNLLSDAAKHELISGIITNDGIVRCFTKVELVNKEITTEQKIDLFEILTNAGIEYFDGTGELLYRGKLAKASLALRGPSIPIQPLLRDYMYVRSGNCCDPDYNSDCYGIKCPPRGAQP